MDGILHRERLDGRAKRLHRRALDELPDGAFDVICKVGGRSGRVVEALTARGYDATNVDGGTDEWIAAGYPVEHAA